MTGDPYIEFAEPQSREAYPLVHGARVNPFAQSRSYPHGTSPRSRGLSLLN
jgi:hypothetical protein